MHLPVFEHPTLKRYWPQVVAITLQVLDFDQRFANFVRGSAEYASLSSENFADCGLWAKFLDNMGYPNTVFEDSAKPWRNTLVQELGKDVAQKWLSLALLDFQVLRQSQPAFSNTEIDPYRKDPTLMDRTAALTEASSRLLRHLHSDKDEILLRPQGTLVLARAATDLPVFMRNRHDEIKLDLADPSCVFLTRQLLQGRLQFDTDGDWQPNEASHPQLLQLAVDDDGYSTQYYGRIKSIRRLLVEAVLAGWAPCLEIDRFCRQEPEYAPIELLSWFKRDWPSAYLPLRETLYKLRITSKPRYRYEMEDVRPRINWYTYAGSRLYMWAVQQLTELLGDKEAFSDEQARLKNDLCELLYCFGPEPDEDRAALVQQLAKAPLAVREVLLRSNRGLTSLLIEACGKGYLVQPLQALRRHPLKDPPEEPRGDIPALATLLQSLSNEDWQWLCTYHLDSENVQLLTALRGDNSKAIEKSAVTKHAHTAIKALGLLPLPAAATRFDASLQRYLQLKTLHQLAAKYGTERSTNQREAVQIGLANLAGNAGYNSLGELEWAMESLQGKALQAYFMPQPIGDYQAYLEMNGTDSAIVITNAKGKALASPPPSSRKTRRGLR